MECLWVLDCRLNKTSYGRTSPCETETRHDSNYCWCNCIMAVMEALSISIFSASLTGKRLKKMRNVQLLPPKDLT